MNSKTIVKVKTPSLEVLELHYAQGSALELSTPLLETNDHVLYVVSGQIRLPDQRTKLSGDCITIESPMFLNECTSIEPSVLLLMITDKKSQQALQPFVTFEDSSNDPKAQLGKSIAQSICASTAIDSNSIAQLLQTLHIRAPFEGDMLNRFTELYLSILSELPLEPLRLNKAYCARICAHWTLNSIKPEKTFYEVIHFIFKLYNDLFLPQIQAPLVREAIFWTLNNTGENKTVQLIAEKLFVNRTHLSERFKKLTGISLSAFIIRVKMYGAMLLLIDDTLSFSDVLDILGYKDSSHFAQNFKKYVGYTPNEYVKMFHLFSK